MLDSLQSLSVSVMFESFSQRSKGVSKSKSFSLASGLGSKTTFCRVQPAREEAHET